jgi:PDZ domain-containing protein
MPVRFFAKTPAIFLALVALAALLLPLPFAIIQPGPASDLLGSNIRVATISKISQLPKTSKVVLKPTNGKLFSLAVFVSNPESRPLGFEVLRAWISGEQVVVPISAVYDPGTTSKAELAIGAKEMSESQQSATIAAANLIKLLHPESSYSFKSSDFTFEFKDVGGPSAGLAFALALFSRILDPTLIAGRVIAATGTITDSGVIGRIGGVNQKYISAKRAKATIFLIPKSNCEDLAAQSNKLDSRGADKSSPKIVAVKSLLEAVHALADSRFEAQYHC